MNQPANATVRPKEKFSVPLNSEREIQSIQRLALDIQNSFHHNCSVNKTNTYQTSSSCNLNEQMHQRQFHSEKRTNRVTNETTPNPYCYKNNRHNPLHFDNNQSSTAQTVLNTQFAAVQINENQNSRKLASAMSLPTVAQTNVSQQFQNPHYPTAVHFRNRNRTEEPNDGNFFRSKNQGTNLVCCKSSQPHKFPLTPENPFTNYQTAIHPPIAQHFSHQNVSGNSQQIPSWSFPGNQPFQPRTEIQTETIPFENNSNLQTTNKSSIKLPITIPNFNGNPLKYHEWIDNFFNLFHNNMSLSDTHRITYLQNSVVGKAKEKIQA